MSQRYRLGVTLETLGRGVPPHESSTVRLLLIAFIASLIPAFPGKRATRRLRKLQRSEDQFWRQQLDLRAGPRRLYRPWPFHLSEHRHRRPRRRARHRQLYEIRRRLYVGPRIALRPHVLPIKPYVEGLVGVGHAEVNQQRQRPIQSATDFSYQLVGGIDYTLLPRIDWRVAEFSYGGLSESSIPVCIRRPSAPASSFACPGCYKRESALEGRAEQANVKP